MMSKNLLLDKTPSEKLSRERRYYSSANYTSGLDVSLHTSRNAATLPAAQTGAWFCYALAETLVPDSLSPRCHIFLRQCMRRWQDKTNSDERETLLLDHAPTQIQLTTVAINHRIDGKPENSGLNPSCGAKLQRLSSCNRSLFFGTDCILLFFQLVNVRIGGFSLSRSLLIFHNGYPKNNTNPQIYAYPKITPLTQ